MKYYLTTTLPYVNADPHIGFALEIVQADAIARWRRSLGDEVVFNTGTDEHGLKIYRKAMEEGQEVQAYVDACAARFGELKDALDLSYTHFIRTTDPAHIAAAQEFWRRCYAKGDIEKKLYKVKYCVGCELEKTDSELEDGRCLLHPNLEIEERTEENYFFKFSRYQKPLLELYASRPDFVIPDFRFNEIKSFVEGGLEDFSVSRLKDKMPWGVPVPGDEDHVMYVWFDALINYVSTLGWPEKEDFGGFWPGLQLAGKDNLRQQSAMWQAMLMSAGLPPSRQIFIHGFITSNGQKMSKSLGNVVDPFQVVREYGTDALRFWLLSQMSPFEDGDFTWDKFKESYNAYLANGLGNLVSRVMKMAITNDVRPPLSENATGAPAAATSGIPGISEAMDGFFLDRAIGAIWAEVQALDLRIQQTEPFKLVKTEPEKAKTIIAELVQRLWTVGSALGPFLPSTAEKIRETIREHRMPEPLFIRKA